MTQRQGVFIRLGIVVLILAVLGVAAYFVVVKLILKNPWELMAEADASIAEAKELESKGDWKTAEKKLLEAEKLLDDILEQKSNAAGVCEKKADIYLIRAKHWVSTNSEISGDYAESAQQWYASAIRNYPAELKLKPAVKLCGVYEKYLSRQRVRSITSIRSVSADVLNKMSRPEPGDDDYEVKIAKWVELNNYLAASTRRYAQIMASQIARKSPEDLGPEERLENYAKVLDELDNAMEKFRLVIDYLPRLKSEDLPEGFTLLNAYLDLAETELHRTDVIWQVYQQNEIEAAEKADNARAAAGEAFQQARETSTREQLEDTIIREAFLRDRYGLDPTRDDLSSIAEQILMDALDVEVMDYVRTSRIYDAAANVKLRLFRKAEARAREARQDDRKNEAAEFTKMAEIKKAEAEAILKEGLKMLPDDPMMFEAVGRFYGKTGDFKKAEETLKKAIEKNPESLHALLKLVEIILSNSGSPPAERAKRAMGSLDKLGEIYPDDINGKLFHGLAEQYLGQGETDDEAAKTKHFTVAERIFDEVRTQGGPQSIAGSHGAFRLAGLYNQWDKPDMAEKLFIECLETPYGRKWPHPHIALANMYVKQGRNQKAIKVYEQFVNSSQALGLKPDADLSLKLATLYATVGKQEKTKEIINRLNEEDPRSGYDLIMAKMVLEDRSASADDIKKLALPPFDAARRTEQKKDIEKRNLQWNFSVIKCHIRLNNKEKIKTLLDEIENDYLVDLKKWRDSATSSQIEERRAIYDRIFETVFAKTYEISRQAGLGAAQSMSKLEMLLLAKPGNPTYEYWKRLEEAENMKPEEKSKYLAEFFIAHIESAKNDATRKLFLLLYGRQLESEGNLDGALEQFKRAHKLDPDGYEVNVFIANIYLMRKAHPDKEAAAPYIEAMIKAGPRQAQTITLQAAFDAAGQEDIKDRIKILKRYILKEKNIPSLYNLLGQACLEDANRTGISFGEQQRTLKDAISSFSKSVDLNPADASIRYRLASTLAYAAGINRAGVKISSRDEKDFLGQANLHMETLLKMRPDSFDFKLLHAQVTYRLGDINRSESLFEDLIVQQEKVLGNAVKADNEALQREIKKNLFSLCLTRRAIAAERGDKAGIEKYREMASRYSEGADINQRLSIDIVNAKALENDDDYAGARVAFEEIQKKYVRPENPESAQRALTSFALFLQRRIIVLKNEMKLPEITLEKQVELLDQEKALRKEFEAFVNESLETYPSSFDIRREKARYYASIVGDISAAKKELEQLLAEERARQKPQANRFSGVAQFYISYPAMKDNIEDAEKLFLEAIKYDSQDEISNQMLVGFYYDYRSRLPGKAMQFIDSQIEKYPENASFMILKAGLLLKEGEYDAAIDWYKKAAETRPDSVDAYKGHADAILARDGYARSGEEAVKILANGIKMAPFNSSIGNALGILYFDLQKYNRAREQFEKVKTIAPGDIAAAVYIARIEINQIPEQTTFIKLRQKTETAALAVSDLLKLDRGNRETEKMLAKLSLYEALFAEKPEEHVKKAVDYYKRAASNSKDPFIFEQLIRLHFEYDWSGLPLEERFLYGSRKLEAWMDLTFPRGEYNYALQLARGRILMLRGDSSAERRIRDAIRIAHEKFPTIPEPYVFLDIFYLDEDNGIEADKAFRTVVELSARSNSLTIAAAHLYERSEKHYRAVELLEQIIPNMTSQDASKLEALAARLCILDPDDPDRDQAVAHARKAIELNPDNAEAQWVLGWADALEAESIENVEEKIAKLNDSIKKMETAVRAFSGSSLAWGCLAKALAELSRLETDPVRKNSRANYAQEAIIRSLAIEPTFDMAPELRKLYLDFLNE